MGAGTLTIICRPQRTKTGFEGYRPPSKRSSSLSFKRSPGAAAGYRTDVFGRGTMSPELLRRNVGIASGAGFRTALFWGVEWYWLRTRGDPSMWEAARALVEEHR